MNAITADSLAETPKEAAYRLAAVAIRDGYGPEALHEYRLADGTPLLWRIRCKRRDGSKWMRPFRWNGVQYVLGAGDRPAEGWPLYRLPELLGSPDTTVWIVEGKHCAD